MINVNTLLAGVMAETMAATGLQPAHTPEPDDGFSNWDNDLAHLLEVDKPGLDMPGDGQPWNRDRPARPMGKAKVAAITALFGRLKARAPASARYQQVAVSCISSIATLYVNLASLDGDLRRPRRPVSERAYGLSPLATHKLLLECGLIDCLSDLLLKPVPAEDDVMQMNPGVRADALWPALDYYILSVIVSLVEVEPDYDKALPRGKTRYLPHGPVDLAEAEARNSCSQLLRAGALPKMVLLATGSRSYLEAARALYALRKMTETSPEACAAIATVDGAITRLGRHALPGRWEEEWAALEEREAPLPAHHAPILASGGSHQGHHNTSFLGLSAQAAMRRAKDRASGQQEHATQVLAHVAKWGGRAAALAIISDAHAGINEGGLLSVCVHELGAALADEGTHVGGASSTHFSCISALALLAGVASHRDLAETLLHEQVAHAQPGFPLAWAIGLNLRQPTSWPLDDWLELLRTLLQHRSPAIVAALLSEPLLEAALPALVSYVGVHPTVSPPALSALKHLVSTSPPPPEPLLLHLIECGISRELFEWAEHTFSVDAHPDEPAAIAAKRDACGDDAEDIALLLSSGALGTAVSAAFEATRDDCASLEREDEEAAEACKARGNALVKKGRHADAADAYTEGLRLVCFHGELTATLRANRAKCYLECGDYARAEREYARRSSNSED